MTALVPVSERDHRMARGLTPSVPETELKERYQRAQQACEEQGFDVILCYGSPIEPSWIRYFANYIHAFVLEDSFIVISRDAPPILLVNRDWILDNAREMSWVEDVRVYPYVEFDWGYDPLVKLFKEIFAPYAQGTIGICDVDMPTKYYRAIREAMPEATIRDGTGLLWSVLEKKSPYDIKMVRQTAQIADQVMMAALNACGHGVPEYEVGLAAERVAWENGCEYGSGSQIRTHLYVGSAIDTISANVHPFRFTRKTLQKGEMFFIDLSVCFEGYYIDFCRTICVGPPSSGQKAVYDSVMEIHKAAFEALRPGVTGEEIWDIGLEIARRGGFEERINCAWLGHGTGLTLSEAPFLAPGEKRKIKANTFVNIEPGNFPAGKIGTSSVEDTIFVGEEKSEFVTNCPRELHIA